MRKILSILCVFIITISLCACSASNNEQPSTSTTSQSATTTTQPTTTDTQETVEENKERASKFSIPATIPEAIVYSGSGDDVLEIEHPDGVYVFYIKGNDVSRYFSVKGYDENGNPVDLFVNTTDPYEGVRIDPDQITTMLEINSNGDWYIEVRSIWTCDIVSEAGLYEGTGDSVFLFDYDNCKTADISGNAESRFFSVKSYGSSNNLMVNTPDPYEGTVMIKYNPSIFVVDSVGSWTIDFN